MSTRTETPETLGTPATADIVCNNRNASNSRDYRDGHSGKNINSRVKSNN
jgi:hypothetical protein